jgi:hypothetical protein
MARRLRERFSYVFRNQDGHKFRAELGDPNASARPRKEIQNLPHRTLVTDRDSIARPGDLVSWNGIQYLLLDQHTQTNTQRFLAAEITHSVLWTRSQKIIDHVTRVEKTSTPVVMDLALPVIMEPRSATEEQDFEILRTRFFTAADVRKGDLLNQLVIKEVHDLFGIRMLEAM